MIPRQRASERVEPIYLPPLEGVAEPLFTQPRPAIVDGSRDISSQTVPAEEPPSFRPTLSHATIPTSPITPAHSGCWIY